MLATFLTAQYLQYVSACVCSYVDKRKKQSCKAKGPNLLTANQHEKSEGYS